MKMRWKEETKGSDGIGFCRTVVVAVKLDALSRELLSWALVKIARHGDRVVALHILHNPEMLDKEGKSSLLSLIKAFESVLSVNKAFCNLKQIDLKLKICRGSSVRRALVQEAKSMTATIVVAGIARKKKTIGCSTSMAKYCSRKLPRECWVLSVNNGKVVFQKESVAAISLSVSRDGSDLYPLPVSVPGAIRTSQSRNSKAFNDRTLKQLLTIEEKNEKNEGTENYHDWELDFCGICIDDSLPHSYPVKNCSIYAPDCVLWEEVPRSEGQKPIAPPCAVSAEETCDDPLAMLTMETSEAALSSVSVLTRDLPETRRRWLLLCRAIVHGWQSTKKSTVRQISVVERAMQLPTPHSKAAVHPYLKPINAEHTTMTEVTESLSGRPSLDGESGAIDGIGNATSPTSVDALNILEKELKSLNKKYLSKCRLFSYQELQSATSNFSSDKLIGKGGNSEVYKGHLPDGKVLAVKILKSSRDSLEEFVLEIEILSTLHHKNVISLFGFCFEENKPVLVYDFIPKGSLEENLHGRKNNIVLSWGERFKAAIGVAQALDYLHSGSAHPVIHRDVKSSNILLTNDFEPKLSDFGLATWASISSAQITCSDVAGTFGYLAPEYFLYGKVNEKIDNYAFGVVLLELLSGRKPINDEYPKGQESLVMWAKPILQSEKFLQVLDPSLGDKYDRDQIERMVLAASLCIRQAPWFRPQMSLILKILQGDEACIKWARLQVTASEEFDMHEASPASDIQSHLHLALLDVEDDSLSVSSIEESVNNYNYV